MARVALEYVPEAYDAEYTQVLKRSFRTTASATQNGEEATAA